METVPLILGVLGVLGGGGIWTYLQSRKEAPVKKKDADMAAADKSVQMALSVATAARDASEALRLDLNAEREARQELSGRVTELSNQVRDQNRTIRDQAKTITAQRVRLRVLSEGWDSLVADWDALRLLSAPPEKPLPRTDDP